MYITKHIHYLDINVYVNIRSFYISLEDSSWFDF